MLKFLKSVSVWGQLDHSKNTMKILSCENVSCVLKIMCLEDNKQSPF